MRKMPGLHALACALFLSACSDSNNGNSTPATPAVAEGTTASLAVLETTDIHTNVLSYDYFKLKEDDSLGFERTATLIKNARAEFPNSILLDDGDTIQGTVLADYQATVSAVPCTDKLAVYKAMDYVGYDAGIAGNHEFNYGLPYLNQVTGSQFNVDGVDASKKCQGPAYPIVLANVVSLKDNKPLFAPYTILKRTLHATGADGKPVDVTLNIGVLGFTPPQIMTWDKKNLDGKVKTQGLVETAQQYIPEMRAKGADLIVALTHGGLDNSAYDPTMENGDYWLSLVEGVDVMLMGHSHQVFPLAGTTVGQFNLPGVDKVNGRVNGVPSVMGNFWGKHLGVVKLALKYSNGAWQVDRAATTAEARPAQTGVDASNKPVYVAADPGVAPLIDTEHQATIQYVKTPIGDSNFRLSTYFADVGDITAIQVVNQAQAAYVADYVAANLPQYAGLPVLSVSAPFKSGFANAADYTDVASGAVAIFNAADLYLYSNTVYAVKVKGSDLKNWLETAAKRFNQIDPASTAQQELVSSFPGYNFDVMEGDGKIGYEIDVTQPVGSRIRNFTYNGSAVDPNADFIVATNNYRANGGGSFPGLDGSKTIYAAPDANRDVLIAYIKKTQHLTGAANGADRSWRFSKVTTAGPVVFHSAPNLAALAQTDGIGNVSQLQADDGLGKGTALYQIDLGQ